MNYEICVIGSEGFLFPFLQFGFATYSPPSESGLRQFLLEASDQNYGIIYIEDSYCHMVADILEKRRSELTPIFIPLGENEDSESYSMQMLRELMDKAVGINIF